MGRRGEDKWGLAFLWLGDTLIGLGNVENSKFVLEMCHSEMANSRNTH